MRFHHKALLVLATFIGVSEINAQSSLNIDFDQVYSKFNFNSSLTSNAGNGFNYLNTGAYHIGYQAVKDNGVMFGLCGGTRNSGALNALGNTNYTWNYQYAEAQLSIGYMFSKWRIRPYVMASPYVAYLLSATEVVGPLLYDNKANGATTTTDMGVIGTAGARVYLSEYINMYSSINSIVGLKNIETLSGKETYNRGFYLNIGIAFTITKTLPRWIQQQH